MSTTITDVLMTSDQTRHIAQWETNGLGHHQGTWAVSWLPQQCFRRDQAITAMTLAETVAMIGVSPESRWWPHIEQWAGELGLTAQQAVELIADVA